MFRIPSFFAPSFRRPKGLAGIITSRFMKKYNFFVYPEIEKYSEIAAGMKILEIGFGPGIGMDYLLSRHDIEMDGVDFSGLMCREAARRNRTHIKRGRLTINCADFLETEYPEFVYDRVIFSNVIYFWSDITSVFRKIHFILKDKGKVIFYMSSPELLRKSNLTKTGDFIHHNIEDVENVLKSCGFKNIETHFLRDDSGLFNIIEAQSI